MVIVCVVVAIIDIIFGIIGLFIFPSFWYVFIPTFLSSGILIYLAMGASTAFRNEKEITKIKAEYKRLKYNLSFIAKKNGIDIEKELAEADECRFEEEKKKRKMTPISELPFNTCVKLKEDLVVTIKKREVTLPRGSKGNLVRTFQNDVTVSFLIDGKTFNVVCDESSLEAD